MPHVEFHLAHDKQKDHMCFLESGAGHEIFSFERNEDVPNCSQCRFQYNYHVVAPCNDCNGFNETGRNYFQQKTWGYW